MKNPLSIKDLINLLYQNREVVEMLFGNKDSINKSEILAREDMTDDKLEKLVMYEIIHENNNIIGLDDRITTFIEEFLEIGEVTTSFIIDNIQTLNESLRYYRIDNNPKFLRNIKRSLKKINSTTSREVMKLHKNIDDTYKNQDNYVIKLQELDKYKRKRDDIINLIKESEQIISEAQGFFNTIIDAELSSIVLDLRYTLVRNRDYLNEIQAQIIDYINKIQYQAAIYKKIQRLKELKDYEELKYKTNFVEVVANIKALFFHKRNVLKGRLSLDFLHSDHGYMLTQKVASKLHLLRNTHRKPAGRMAAGFDDSNLEESSSLNITGLVEKFVKTDEDLFQFVMKYQFPEKVGELSLEKRISLYVGISIDFDDKLQITGDFGRMNFINEKGLNQRVGYAIIKARKQKVESGKAKVKVEENVEREVVNTEAKSPEVVSPEVGEAASNNVNIPQAEDIVPVPVESVVEVTDIPKTKRKKTTIENVTEEVATEDIPVKADSKKSRSKRKTKDTASEPEPAEAVMTEGQQPDDNAKPKAKSKTRTSKLKAQS
ncbi:hypothetical protein ACFQ21_09870 [Ohtaekwangia kribbensis]|uniref:Uncharacterized protein n=1 Tax=Ohtaekwangia kribbensis TaxID=688913 RepID=A0ABW3K2F9_9BACT